MDIVIPVKEAMINEELRYTLRSICANFPHDKIWIVGYKPSWLNGDVSHIPGNNAIGSKYEKVLSNHLITNRHPLISDDYYLFNDDFFVLRPVHIFKNYYRCTIDESIARLLEYTNGVESSYLRSLIRTKEILQAMGIEEPLDFGLHLPIQINKKNWREAYQQMKKYNPEGAIVHMRTIYGNLFLNSGGLGKMNDVKITTLDQEPDPEWYYCSTVDSSFISGAVGKYVQARFQEMCKCEGAIRNTFLTG